MQRLRRFLRRVARPAAMVGVVGMLSFGLVITTPSNAHALAGKPPVPPGVIAGAIRTWAPKIGTAIFEIGTSFTPMGWGLKAAVGLGMLAWSTSDIWMPYVTGAFGNPEQNVPNTNGTGKQSVDPKMTLSGGTISGDSAFATLSYAQTGGGFFSYTVATRYECDWDNPGFANTIFKGSAGASNVTTPMTPRTIQLRCDAQQGATHLVGHPVGAEWGQAGTGSFLPYDSSTMRGSAPTNYVSVGGFGLNAFDPHSPDVKYQGSAECIAPDGTLTWITGDLIPGDVGAVKMPSCEARGLGHGTGRTKVTGFKPDGTPVPLWDVPTAPTDPSTPLCDPGRASSGCVLEVIKDGQPCAPGDVECENWIEQNNADPNKDTSTSRFKCKFGPYIVPMSVCSMLEKAYRPGGAPATEENTDGDPSTSNNNDPNGNPIAAPAPAPVAGTTPGTTPGPGTGGQVAPGPAGDTKARECFPTGWAAFNPVEWVLKPLRCAFEPTVDTSTMQTTIRDKLQARAPVSWMNSIAGMQGPGGGSCPNWQIHVGSFAWSAVCDSTFTGAVRGIRTPLFGILATAMVWPLIRSIWYAAIPVLRVAPSSGK